MMSLLSDFRGSCPGENLLYASGHQERDLDFQLQIVITDNNRLLRIYYVPHSVLILMLNPLSQPCNHIL